METVKDFFQSVYDSYKDRIKNPLIGSFMISFIIFNWRAFAILFISDWPIHTRIKWVEDHYSENKNFVWPFVISIFYVLILPYINLGLDWLLSMYSNKKMLKINYKRNTELVRRKAEAVILREIADAQAGTSEINNLKERNDSLVKELNNTVIQMEEDLKRHNATVEQYQTREKELKEQNRKYVIAELLNNDVEFYVTSEDIQKMNEIYNVMTEKGRTHYLEAITELENENYKGDLNSLLRYRDLDLVEFDSDESGKKIRKVTNLGKTFFTYLKKGYDLM
ncbi:hypothetical protein [Flavobacterium tructae]|uniref:Uncharacterized protein n=1 Tax=Flavobacterium tructae TaxID=1114873 RepID=A0A1S1J1I9_9FLAO|nr:hypothetical protein [Flavobacterium tructae]OHT44442.1 hypothetical protein BHE19_12030 [Flavobacterium tructae]OXB19422.1 hypothetical protein B0A71_12845 [Flavobacterium tructae]